MGAWVGTAADFASLASLLVSFYAAWQITAVRRKVSRRIIFNVLAESLIKDVETDAAWVASMLTSPRLQERDVDQTLARCLARLRRTREEVPENLLVHIKALDRLEKEWRKAASTGNATRCEDTQAEKLWSIVRELNVFADGLRELVVRRRIGGSDDV